MNVLVTGSSGFIGTYLVEALQVGGHHVVGLDREGPSWREPDEFVQGDVLDDGPLARALCGVECVFHLAAAKDDWGISYEEYFRDNARATERLLALGGEHGIERWVHYSTVGVLPRGPHPLDESAALDPDAAYGASKAAAETMFVRYGRSRPDTAIVILRPSAVFGPRNPPTTNVHRLVEAIRADRFVMVGDGDTPKTTSYIENLLSATTYLFAGLGRGTRIFHYVDQPVMTTEYLVAAIYEQLGKRRPRVRIPLPVARSVGYVGDLAARLLRVDLPITGARIEKFCTPTNFNAHSIREHGFDQPVGNREAIARTVEWHVDKDEL